MERNFKYRSEIQELPLIRQDLSGLAAVGDIPESELRQIIVIIEELFSNIIRFAFKDSREHLIEIQLRKVDSAIVIAIIDDGIPFNPLDYNPAPVSDPATSDTRGMGITLVKTFSDAIEYRRSDNRNHLEITKTIKSKPNTEE
ncbi:MAG: ATP-binding protein [Bacteroidales bacterium]|nr:ATP-binding protein [Bacteroidales bacterium]